MTHLRYISALHAERIRGILGGRSRVARGERRRSRHRRRRARQRLHRANHPGTPDAGGSADGEYGAVARGSPDRRAQVLKERFSKVLEEEEDARAAMEVTKPSAVLHLSRYEDWCAQFGDHRH